MWQKFHLVVFGKKNNNRFIFQLAVGAVAIVGQISFLFAGLFSANYRYGSHGGYGLSATDSSW